MLISGFQGQGKSYLTRHLVKETGAQYHSILVFCSTAGANPETYDYIDQNFVHIMFDEEILRAYIDLHVNNPNIKGLLILDDVVGTVNLGKPIFKELFSNMRHLRINVIILENYWMSCPRALRAMCAYVVQFQLDDDEMLEEIRKQFGGSEYGKANRQEFFNIIKKLPKYCFLVISKYELDVKTRFRIMRAPEVIKPFRMSFSKKKKL